MVLDEAHSIKDRRCSTARAVFALTSKYKWALSGTPLQVWPQSSTCPSSVHLCVKRVGQHCHAGHVWDLLFKRHDATAKSSVRVHLSSNAEYNHNQG